MNYSIIVMLDERYLFATDHNYGAQYSIAQQYRELLKRFGKENVTIMKETDHMGWVYLSESETEELIK